MNNESLNSDRDSNKGKPSLRSTPGDFKKLRKEVAKNIQQKPKLTVDKVTWKKVPSNDSKLTISFFGEGKEFKTPRAYEGLSTEFKTVKWENVDFASNLFVSVNGTGKGLANTDPLETACRLHIANQLIGQVNPDRIDTPVVTDDVVKQAAKGMANEYLKLKPTFKVVGKASFDGDYKENLALAKKRMDIEIKKLKKQYGDNISIDPSYMVVGPEGKKIQRNGIKEAWVDLLVCYMDELDDVPTIKELKRKLYLFDTNQSKLSQEERDFFNTHITNNRGAEITTMLPEKHKDAQFAFRLDAHPQDNPDNNQDTMLASNN